MTKRLKTQRIRTKPSKVSSSSPNLELGGWFQGKDTYLWIGYKDSFLGYVAGRKLYRLAKAIVERYEDSR